MNPSTQCYPESTKPMKQMITRLATLLQEQEQQTFINSTILQFFDLMPFPAWIKTFDRTTNEFTLLKTNIAFQRQIASNVDLYNLFIANKRELIEKAGVQELKQTVTNNYGHQVECICFRWSIFEDNQVKAIAGFMMFPDSIVNYKSTPMVKNGHG